MQEYRTIDAFSKYGQVKAFYTLRTWHLWPCFDSPDEAGVSEPYQELADVFETDVSRIVRIPQTHTDAVRVIRKEDAGDGIVRCAFPGYDGIITDVTNVMLTTVEADCVPVYLYDPVHGAIGMIHSGWKGTAGCIAQHAVELMRDTYGSDPSDLVAALGPCICGSCYEVGGELIEPFLKHFSEVKDQIFRPKGAEKYLLDLPAAICYSLQRAGLAVNRIHPSPACTYESKDLCSWRRDAVKTDRMLTGIMLTDK